MKFENENTIYFLLILFSFEQKAKKRTHKVLKQLNFDFEIRCDLCKAKKLPLNSLCLVGHFSVKKPVPISSNHVA